MDFHYIRKDLINKQENIDFEENVLDFKYYKSDFNISFNQDVYFRKTSVLIHDEVNPKFIILNTKQGEINCPNFIKIGSVDYVLSYKTYYNISSQLIYNIKDKANYSDFIEKAYKDYLSYATNSDVFNFVYLCREKNNFRHIARIGFSDNRIFINPKQTIPLFTKSWNPELDIEENIYNFYTSEKQFLSSKNIRYDCNILIGDVLYKYFIKDGFLGYLKIGGPSDYNSYFYN